MEDLNSLNQNYFADYDYNSAGSCGLIAVKKKKKKKPFPQYFPITKIPKCFKATGSHEHSCVSVFVASFRLHLYWTHIKPMYFLI